MSNLNVFILSALFPFNCDGTSEFYLFSLILFLLFPCLCVCLLATKKEQADKNTRKETTKTKIMKENSTGTKQMENMQSVTT
jgi:hypothetical protein